MLSSMEQGSVVFSCMPGMRLTGRRGIEWLAVGCCWCSMLMCYQSSKEACSRSDRSARAPAAQYLSFARKRLTFRQKKGEAEQMRRAFRSRSRTSSRTNWYRCRYAWHSVHIWQELGFSSPVFPATCIHAPSLDLNRRCYMGTSRGLSSI